MLLTLAVIVSAIVIKRKAAPRALRTKMPNIRDTYVSMLQLKKDRKRNQNDLPENQFPVTELELDEFERVHCASFSEVSLDSSVDQPANDDLTYLGHNIVETYPDVY